MKDSGLASRVVQVQAPRSKSGYAVDDVVFLARCLRVLDQMGDWHILSYHRRMGLPIRHHEAI